MWDIVPWPGIKPRPPALGAQGLDTGPPGKSPERAILKHEKHILQLYTNKFECLHVLHVFLWISMTQEEVRKLSVHITT